MPGELERIAQIDDPYELLRAATERLAEAQQEVTELARLRRRLIQDLHAQGMSYAQIAQAAGLSRGRIHQIRHTGPAPEGAFLGSGEVTVVTPLRPDPASDRTYVALDDLKTGQRVEELARTFDLAVNSDHVGIDGGIDLNRPGLLVICGPRMSPAMREAYDKDPVLEWERDEVGWLLRDIRTGDEHRSGQEDDPPRPYDIGYLGRLPRPDGNGSFIAIAGVHPEGSLGVVHLLTTDIGSLWGQVGGDRFSVVVGTEYAPDTHEPVRTELLTPIYRHDEAPT
ncbi:sigma-70 family RNA polymerase sigma factor [Actinomadura bangladeshensis]|uniref:Sigma-70 family RNA polymerase sigma factor n=1 Tax=Actinomadura bangladeshensis TaxID=453573 RepID=A0A6L9QS44_9ACTN|nr:sigma-70 family RNA polymerase sigma factor [Actinomadura bangladeshensis]NEA28319.1 sigma-70 family RNA polymerase sigma factor [Actinomadura bangladeshensis]